MQARDVEVGLDHASRSWRWLFGGSFAFLVLACGVVVTLPFTGDQALYALGASELSHGAVLYRDFWDFKPPGIYWFYEAGSTVFGFTDLGQHVWEVLWWLAFAAFLAWVLRARVRHQQLAALAPLLVAIYLLALRPNDLGQLEDLIAIPLFVALWAVDDSGGSVSRWRWFASGLAGAVVVVFKHPFVIIPLAFWLRALVRSRRRGDSQLGAEIGALLVGFALPLVPVAAYFSITGQWGQVWWTYFHYAPKTTSIDPRPLSRLVDGATHLVTRQLPFIVLALVAVVAQVRGRRRPLVTELVWWLLLAIPVVLIGLWWPYHFIVFEIPLMVLAVFGADDLLDRGTRRQVMVGIAALLVLLVPSAHDAAMKAIDVGRHDFALTVDGRRAIREHDEPDYTRVPEVVALLHETGARPGDVYVVADPIFQLASGRRQAIAYNGWNADVSDRELFRRTRDELDEKRPPYVFIDDGARALIAERSPELDALLREQYHERQRVDFGAWYEANS